MIMFSHWYLLPHFQVCVENLCTKQMENEVEVRGPPVSKSFDDQGNPTKVILFLSYLFTNVIARAC